MLCLTLASCACDRVPAFLFIRPYEPSQRRWDLNGEIEQKKVPETIALPQWPKGIFIKSKKSSEQRREGSYEAATLGYPWTANDQFSFTLAADIAELSSHNIVSFDLDEDYVLLAMPPAVKETLWSQTSTDDRLFIWFDLLRLVVFSFPDVCAEIMWQHIQWRCRDVVRSTIIPFLSVVGWSELESTGA